jgi:TolB-like protein
MAGLALLLLPALAGAQDSRPGVAVWTFRDGGSFGQEAEDFEALTVGLQQMLITEFAQNSQLRVVDRDRLNELLAEQDLGASGRVEDGTAARIGKLVGAKYMVLGGFIDFYGEMRLDTRIVNVETSELVKAYSVRGEREKMFSLVVDLAVGITDELSLPALAKQAMQERQDRAEEIPHEAVRMYTKAILAQDRGDTERAIELFSSITEEFPNYTEAGEALKQLRSGE